MLAPIRTVAPATLPVTLAEAKAHLAISHSDQDDMVTALLNAAVGHVDGWSGVLGRALINQTWQQDFRGFYDGLRLGLAPVSSVTSVTYYDGDNASQTLDAATYQVLAEDGGTVLRLAPDQTWPGVYNRPDAIRATYVAGYGASASDVPSPIRHAILMLVAHWYLNREPASIGAAAASIPLTVDALLLPFRRGVTCM